MRFFLMQDLLHAVDGHFFGESLAWREACAVRGLDIEVFAGTALAAPFAEQLRAHQVFDTPAGVAKLYIPQGESNGAPLRWFTDFNVRSRIVERGCRRAFEIVEVGPSDVVVFPFADAGAMNGAAEWLADTAPERRPTLLFNFHKPEPTISVDAERRNVTGGAVHLQFAARRLRALLPADRLVLTAFDVNLSRLISTLTSTPCHKVPYRAACGSADGGAAPSVQAGAKGPVVSAMGMLRFSKGGALVLDIVRLLHARRPEAVVFLQMWGEEQAALMMRSLRDAGSGATPVIATGALSAADYRAQVRASDLVLAPYRSTSYAFQSSGVFSDAVGAGIPVVVPAKTWLSDRLDEGYGAGVTFAAYSAESVVEAIVQALDRLPALRAKSQATAADWMNTHAFGGHFDAVLRLLADAGGQALSPLAQSGSVEPA